MNLRLSKMQKTVLNMLLDTYENSATYRGTAAKNQSFSINLKRYILIITEITRIAMK